MNDFSNLSPSQLRKAANLKEQIEALQKELASLLGGASAPASKAAKPAVKAITKAAKKKGGMSAAARAKIAAAAKARWAKAKASGRNSL